MTLTTEQERAVNAATEALRTNSTLSIGGLAGTGKTTIVKEIIIRTRDDAKLPVLVGAFTGKAVHMLRRKGATEARTLHSILYEPAFGREILACDMQDHECKKNRARYWPKENLNCRGVIIDEASMVNGTLHDDLLRHNVPLVFIGDHGQLAPIGSDPGVMRHPDVTLNQIHRQAEDNPILHYAHALRNGMEPRAYFTLQDKGDTRLRRISRNESRATWHAYDAVICGYNNTRRLVNAEIRKARGLKGLVETSDRLMVLKNDRDLGVFNGSLITVKTVLRSRDVTATIDATTEDGHNLDSLDVAFTDPGATEDGESPVDYGYAMTCHKAQGSEADNVLVLEELAPTWDARRWRYTAATRAKVKLAWCGWQQGPVKY